MAVLKGMSRIGDITTGDGCYPPTIGTVPPPPIPPATTPAPPNVFVNGIPAHKQGDVMLPQVCGGVPRTDVAGVGSLTVRINGVSAMRIGDPLVPGGKFAEGSHNVFIGDNPVV